METFFFLVVVIKGIGWPPNFPFLGRGKLDGHSIQKTKVKHFFFGIGSKGNLGNHQIF